MSIKTARARPFSVMKQVSPDKIMSSNSVLGLCCSSEAPTNRPDGITVVLRKFAKINSAHFSPNLDCTRPTGGRVDQVSAFQPLLSVPQVLRCSQVLHSLK